MSHPVKISENLPWNYTRYLLGLLILALSYWPAAVTTVYTPFIFKPVSNLLRLLFGGIRFPIGEFVYLLIIIWLIFSLLKWLYTKKGNFGNLTFWKVQGVHCLNGLVALFIIFELLWGLNYQKKDPSQDFYLKVPLSYSESQMDSLSLSLIKSLNSTRAEIGNFSPKMLEFDTIMAKNKAEFAKNSEKWRFLKYQNGSVKEAIFPSWGDYIGYTAFYHPITSEAIVRGDLPKLTMPFTMSHEIAHQLGYASEEQANFIAYVIGMESKLPLFKYSCALQLFTYAQYAHLSFIAKRGDFALYKQVVERNKQMLSPQVLADRKEIKQFFLQKQDLQIQGTTELYNQFLIWNKQAKGIDSYNDVLRWVLAYENKKKSLADTKDFDIIK
jgi:hypothetical protein